VSKGERVVAVQRHARVVQAALTHVVGGTGIGTLVQEALHQVDASRLRLLPQLEVQSRLVARQAVSVSGTVELEYSLSMFRANLTSDL
jgi:hypothetical protein